MPIINPGIPYYSAPPIVKLSDTPGLQVGLRGSSFVVAGEHARTLVVTAAHVVQSESDDGAGRGLGVVGYFREVVQAHTLLPLLPVLNWHVRPDVDLAVGYIDDCEEATGLIVTESEYPINSDVVTIEHSRSVYQSLDQPRTAHVAPMLRKGHIVQRRQGLHPQFPATMALELSYGAMSGASGAPVFREDTSQVIGVIISNLDRELLPAHVLETFDEEGNKVEAVSYIMSNAIAIEVDHLRSVIVEAESRFA